VLRTRDGSEFFLIFWNGRLSQVFDFSLFLELFAAKLEVCDIATRALSMDYLVLKAANKSHLTHFCNLVDRGMIQKHFKFLIMNRVCFDLFLLINWEINA